MYGQMTAGSWIYIGTQGILQGTYETFAAAAKKHFGGNLSGKLVATGGMGGMGGAQPLAATMNGAAFLGIDVDPERIKKRLKTGYCDVMVTSLDEALRILKNAVRKGEATSVGLVGNCADLIPELAKRGVVPDLLTDRAHTIHRRIRAERDDFGCGAGAAEEESKSEALMAAMAPVRILVAEAGRDDIRHETFERCGRTEVRTRTALVVWRTFGRSLRGKDRFGRRFQASGHRANRQLVLGFFRKRAVGRWIKLAQKREVSGAPSRICWLHGERDKFGLALVIWWLRR
jgi:urocanate hydratase